MKTQAPRQAKDVVSGTFVARGAKPISRKAQPNVFLHNLAGRISPYFPDLKKHMIMAGMEPETLRFISWSILSAFYLSAIIAIAIMVGIWMWGKGEGLVYPVIFLPVLYLIAFLYFMQFPSVKAKQREKNIDQELVFAGRHMLIALKAGVPLFDAMLGITRDYGEVSKEFNKIVEKITLGVPSNIAIHEVTETNPSAAFRRMMLQITNSMASGSDVATGLAVVLDHISREQVIQMKEYGQKLNPFAMFFMIFGVIMPSLGVAFAIILLSFVGAGNKFIGTTALLGTLALIITIQFIFLSMIETSRPKFDIA